MALLFSMILKKYHPPPPPPKKKEKKKENIPKWVVHGTCNRETMPIPGAHNLGGGGGWVV